MFDLSAVQAAIRDSGFDGWLLYDFRGLNVLARRVLKIDESAILTRRWFYFVPAQGSPRKLLHRIEPHALDHLPGEGQLYLRWQELEQGVGKLVSGARRVAMEYVPRNANPYVSRVDAGTVELVRSFGVEVLASVATAAGERAVAVRQGNLLATSFHPEMTGDLRVHRLFVDVVRSAAG